MIQSDILKEKQRVQTMLSSESASIHEYIVNSHIAAKEIASLYGFRLKYAEIHNASSGHFDHRAAELGR